MTAISAAIVELEAQRERLGLLISELRRHERAIESSYPDLTAAPQTLGAKLRSGSAAGTPSGPAGGSGHDHRRPRTPTGSPPFETVWNGTKERAGQAPSLLPPRERKP